jgi:GTP-binding protein
MFIDEAVIRVQGGSGGNGAVAFRREKHVPKGGPSGGDGGDGGNVILVVDAQTRTLLDFEYQTVFKAAAGGHGQGKRMTGGRGEDLLVEVPPGTVVYEAQSGEKVGDLTTPGQKLLVARGGTGGRGNVRFTTSTRQAPRIAENGLPGEQRELRLELQVLADVGLVGMPNAGKSTLLSHISAAKPEVAAYPFTTLQPQLGVVKLPDEREFVVADLPGLIEGAHRGVGLGDQFLRHVRRTRVLLHVIDAAGVDGREPGDDYAKIREELEAYDAQVAALPEIVVLNKMDLPTAQENLAALEAYFQERAIEYFPLAAVTGQGLEQMLWAVASRLEAPELEEEIPPTAMYAEIPLAPTIPLQIRREAADRYRATGTEVERLAQQAKFDHFDSSHHYHQLLRAAGLFSALDAAGAQSGDTVLLGDHEFEYEPD